MAKRIRSSGTKRKRRASYSGPAVKKRAVSRMKRAVSKLKPKAKSAGTLLKQSGRRVHKEAVGKKVKVSKPFKQKVKKALESKEPYGFYQETFTSVLKHGLTDLQVAGMIPRADGTETKTTGGTIISYPTTASTTYSQSDSCDGILFDPSRVLNAASVLWNKKQNNVDNYTMADATNFDPRSTIINVRKSWAKINIKNNGKRQMVVKLFICSPNQIKTTTASPLLDWQQIDHNLFQNTALTGDDGRINVGTYDDFLATRHTNIGYDPRHIPDWKKWWSADVTTYSIEPGEMVVHTVNGPREKLYRYQKFLAPQSGNNPGTLVNSQKFTKWVMAVAYPDLESGKTKFTAGTPNMYKVQNVGRIIDFTSNPFTAATGGLKMEHSLLFETTMFYELSMPEQTGWGNAPSGGATVHSNSLRHDAFSITYHPNSNDANGGVDPEPSIAQIVNAENPVQDMDQT